MQGSAILPKRRAESIGATAAVSTRKAAAESHPASERYRKARRPGLPARAPT